MAGIGRAGEILIEFKFINVMLMDADMSDALNARVAVLFGKAKTMRPEQVQRDLDELRVVRDGMDRVIIRSY